MPSGRVVALEGVSAAGKTTVAGALGRREGWTVVPEAFRRLDPSPSLDFGSPEELLRLEERLLEEDARRFREARAAARSGATVLADTGFLGPLTYVAGLVALGLAPTPVLSALRERADALGSTGAWGLPDGVVWLEASARDRERRAAGDPEGHPTALAERHAAVGSYERRLYARAIGPLFGPRFVTVPADGRPAAVARRADAAVRAVVRARSRLPSVAEVVALIEAPRRETNGRGNR